MFVRVASFENTDMSRIDDLIATVQQRVREGSDVPDARRMLLLVDRGGRQAFGLTFFDTEDAIRRAEPAFERMGDEIPEAERGKRTSVEVYEAIIDDVEVGAMAARMTSLEGAAERLDDGAGFIKETIVPAAAGLSGWMGILTLLDRANGRARTITFWDSEESLRASDERANELRSQAAEALQETVTGVDRLEVAFDLVLASTRA